MSHQQFDFAQTSAANQNRSMSGQGQRPYSVMKYQQTYITASNKLIQFFTLQNLKKYIDYDSKTKFQRELMDQILKQLRQFLRKKAARQFQNMMTKQILENGGIKLQQKFEAFDELFFRKFVLSRLQNKTQQLQEMSPFQIFDIEDEVLNQLQSSLAKTYAQI